MREFAPVAPVALVAPAPNVMWLGPLFPVVVVCAPRGGVCASVRVWCNAQCPSAFVPVLPLSEKLLASGCVHWSPVRIVYCKGVTRVRWCWASVVWVDTCLPQALLPLCHKCVRAKRVLVWVCERSEYLCVCASEASTCVCVFWCIGVLPVVEVGSCTV